MTFALPGPYYGPKPLVAMSDTPTSLPQQGLAAARRFWGWLTHRYGRQEAWLVILTFLALVAFLIYLVKADNPWDRHLPEKIKAAEKLTFRDLKVLGLWSAAAGNALICLFLLATAGWWTGGRHVIPPAPVKPVVSPTARRWFWALVLFAVVLGARERWPRLTHSLVNDEEQALRKFVFGEYLPEKEGTLKLKELDWDHTLYYTITGNNHVIHSVGARLGLNTWQHWQHGLWKTFSEAAVRIEPLVVGLASLVVLALLGRTLGYPVVGLVAAFFLALHPWHVRYSVEARGYSGHLFCVLLSLLFLALAFQDRQRWRWWMGFGAAQSCYLMYYAGGIYFAAGMNAVLFLGFLLERDFIALRRWFVACAVGAMAFFQIIAPTLPKIGSWMERTGSFALPPDFTLDLWSHLLAGIPWSDALPELHRGMGLKRWIADLPLVGFVALALAPLQALVGMGLLAWRTRFGRYAAAGFLLSTGLVAFQLTRNPVEFYAWYLFFLLAGFVIFAACILLILEHSASGTTRNRWLVPISILIVTGYAIFTWAPLEGIRLYDRQPMRQAVISARGEAPAYDTRHAALMTASVGSGNGQLKSYDPRVRPCDTLAEFDAVIAEARASHKPLTVYLCGSDALSHKNPELFARLEEPGLFEKGEYLKGLEEYWGYQILRLKTSP